MQKRRAPSSPQLRVDTMLPCCVPALLLPACSLAAAPDALHPGCCATLPDPAALLPLMHVIAPRLPMVHLCLQQDVFVAAERGPTGAPSLGSKAKKCDRFVNQAMEVGPSQASRIAAAAAAGSVVSVLGAGAREVRPGARAQQQPATASDALQEMGGINIYECVAPGWPDRAAGKEEQACRRRARRLVLRAVHAVLTPALLSCLTTRVLSPAPCRIYAGLAGLKGCGGTTSQQRAGCCVEGGVGCWALFASDIPLTNDAAAVLNRGCRQPCVHCQTLSGQMCA